VVSALIESAHIDCGYVGGKHPKMLTVGEYFHGKSWDLYFLLKVRSEDRLRAAFEREPFQDRPVLRPPDRVMPQLNGLLPGISIVRDDRNSICEFLADCDRLIASAVGEDGLARYLETAPVSVQQFLDAAPKWTFLGLRV
jgi:hypothetical protein